MKASELTVPGMTYEECQACMDVIATYRDKLKAEGDFEHSDPIDLWVELRHAIEMARNLDYANAAAAERPRDDE